MICQMGIGKISENIGGWAHLSAQQVQEVLIHIILSYPYNIRSRTADY